MKRKLLLVGGSGFVGNYYREIESRYDLVSTFNTRPISDGIYYNLEEEGLEGIVLKHNITHVLFMGGIVNFNTIHNDPLRAKYINVDCTIQRIQEVISSGAKLVYFSSESVFSGNKGNYCETDEPDPMFDYGKQKYTVEKYIQHNTDNYLILRLAKVFASDKLPPSLVTSWLSQLSNNEDICVAYDNIFSPIHITDAINLISLLIGNECNGIFNICSPEPLSRSKMLDIVLDEYTKIISYSGKVKRLKLNQIKGAENLPLNTSLTNKKVALATDYKSKGFSYWGRSITQIYFNSTYD